MDDWIAIKLRFQKYFGVPDTIQGFPQKCLICLRYCILPLLTVLPLKSECKVASPKKSPYNSILRCWIQLNRAIFQKMHPYCIYSIFTVFSIYTHKISMVYWNDIRLCVHAYSWGPNPTSLDELLRNAPITVYNCISAVSYSISQKIKYISLMSTRSKCVQHIKRSLYTTFQALFIEITLKSLTAWTNKQIRPLIRLDIKVSFIELSPRKMIARPSANVSSVHLSSLSRICISIIFRRIKKVKE